MSRNGSGTFSVINTMVANTTITAAAHNENYSDIGDEITNSVAADGQTTMSGNLKHANGTAALPAITFGSDTDTGFFRAAENSIGLALGGVQYIVITTATAVFAMTIQAPNLPFPSGTAMLFVQTAAPTGWTKSGVHNDKALRVVTGAASSGGSSAFSTVFGKTATDGTALTQANMANYNLSLAGLAISATFTGTPMTTTVPFSTGATTNGSGSAFGYVDNVGTGASIATTAAFTPAGSISAGISGTLASGGSSTAHTHTMDIRVQYVDCIIATKD